MKRGSRRKEEQARLARPKVRELRKLYRGLLSASVVHRVETLKTMLQWYDQAMDYVTDREASAKKKWRSEVRNVKADIVITELRRKAMDTIVHEEKEQLFREAVLQAEIVCKRLHPYPIKRVFKEYEERQARLEQRQERLSDRYGKVLDLIKAALKPSSRLHVDNVSKTTAGQGRVLYSRTQIAACREVLRKQGLLPLAVNQVKFLSRAAALEEDGNGQFEVNSEKQVNMVFEMLDNLVAYCQGPDAPRRLAKGGE